MSGWSGFKPSKSPDLKILEASYLSHSFMLSKKTLFFQKVTTTFEVTETSLKGFPSDTTPHVVINSPYTPTAPNSDSKNRQDIVIKKDVLERETIGMGESKQKPELTK